MKSLLQLLFLLLYFYLGMFTMLAYIIIFYFQKKFKLIKTIIFFFIISTIWIKIRNKYDTGFNLIYPLFFIAGNVCANIIFKPEIKQKLTMFNKKYIIIKLYLKSIRNYVLIPPIFYKLWCKIYSFFHYKKHPLDRPPSIRRLF